MLSFVCFSHLIAIIVIANISAEKDDSDAIDQSNIVEGRTRGAKPSEGYAEPGDEEVCCTHEYVLTLLTFP